MWVSCLKHDRHAHPHTVPSIVIRRPYRVSTSAFAFLSVIPSGNLLLPSHYSYPSRCPCLSLTISERNCHSERSERTRFLPFLPSHSFCHSLRESAFQRPPGTPRLQPWASQRGAEGLRRPPRPPPAKSKASRRTSRTLPSKYPKASALGLITPGRRPFLAAAGQSGAAGATTELPSADRAQIPWTAESKNQALP
jgi:hypothetical protein